MIIFRESDHTYWQGDREIPGVTTILKPLCDFSHIREEVLARKSALGTAVHFATELFDEDDLDWDSLTEEQAGYTRGWAKFREEQDVEIIGMEQKVYHDTMRYAGTLDRRLILNGTRGILDIKTSAVMSAATGVQTAAYAEAAKRTWPDEPAPEARWGLQLKPDGTYRLHAYESKRDWATFLSLLTIHAWKMENAK